jgi:hypothetical protein
MGRRSFSSFSGLSFLKRVRPCGCPLSLLPFTGCSMNDPSFAERMWGSMLVAAVTLVTIFVCPSEQRPRQSPKSHTIRAVRRPVEFRPGMSKEDVDDLIRQYKLEHHYDEPEHKIYANLGAFARTGTSSASLQNEIVLGRDGKVATVRETIVFTGGCGFAGSREIQ